MRFINLTHFLSHPRQIEKGETPIEISVMRLAIDGFVAEWELARSKFIPSCLCYTCLGFPAYQSNGSVSSDLTKEVTIRLILLVRSYAVFL